MFPFEPEAMALYTIGHSNHSIDRFLDLLREHGIEVVIDVRSRPASRWCPQFNRKALEKSLAEAGIEYRWMGRYLGGPGGTSVLAEEFVTEIREVLQLAADRSVVLMCSERAPESCHRATKLLAWVHRASPGTVGLHIIPQPGGTSAAVDSPTTEQTLKPELFWWELHTRGCYGKPGA